MKNFWNKIREVIKGLCSTCYNNGTRGCTWYGHDKPPETMGCGRWDGPSS